MNVSTLISSQLPKFISGDKDYSVFVKFLETYYQWMEQEKNTLFHSNNLLEYLNVDETLPEFLDYFYNQFLPSFPTEVAADKRKLLRFAKKFYQTKGTPDSYKFLFKVLYESDCEIIETNDFVFKPSDGQWFSPKSVKIKSLDERFILCENLFLLGEKSKTLARIERAKLVGDKIEIFISDIQRLFNIGEFVRVVNFKGEPYYFDIDGNIVDDILSPDGEIIYKKENRGTILRTNIVSSISNAYINNNYRGNYYNAGNPVVFYNGLDNILGKGAEAVVGDVNVGFIQKVNVDYTSCLYGYRDPYTAVYVDPDINKKTIITISSVDKTNPVVLDNIIEDSLQLRVNEPLNCDPNTGFSTNPSTNYGFSSTISANANTIMSDVFSIKSYETYKLNTLIVNNGGGGFINPPTVTAHSMYPTTLPLSRMDEDYDPRYDFDSNLGETLQRKYTSLYNLGILAPIKIISGGIGYKQDLELYFSGIGTGAFAKITKVNEQGAITEVSYYQKPEVKTPLGGIGYTDNPIPTITIQSLEYTKKCSATRNSNILTINDTTSTTTNLIVGMQVIGLGLEDNTFISNISGSNITLSKKAIANHSNVDYKFCPYGANLVVPGLMGGSAILSPITDRVGSINNIKITNYGEDYVSVPSLSLKIQDFVIYNVDISHLPVRGDKLSNTSYGYTSTIDSVSVIEKNDDTTLIKYLVRTYNYNKKVDANNSLKVVKSNISYPVSIDNTYVFPKDYFGLPKENIGVATFGDGTAKGSAKFLNGLILGQGRYLNENGHPSSYSVIQNENFNSYTYILSVQKEISKYRNMVNELIHPAGTKIIGQARIDSFPRKTPTYVEQFYQTNTTDDFDLIFAGIASEPNSNTTIKESRLISFNESISKYGTLLQDGGNVIQLSNFPTQIFVGQKVEGQGIPIDSYVKDIILSSNSIELNQQPTENLDGIDLQFKSYDVINDENPIIFTAKVKINSTNKYITILPESLDTNILEGITTNLYVKVDPVIVLANTIQGNNKLLNAVSVNGIASGQVIKAEHIPVGSVTDGIEDSSIIMVKGANYPSSKIPSNALSTKIYFDSYYDKMLNMQITSNVNAIKIYNVPDNTRVTTINKIDNTITISNSCILPSPTKMYHFCVASTLNTVDISSNEISLRVETGSINERQ